MKAIILVAAMAIGSHPTHTNNNGNGGGYIDPNCRLVGSPMKLEREPFITGQLIINQTKAPTVANEFNRETYLRNLSTIQRLMKGSK